MLLPGAKSIEFVEFADLLLKPFFHLPAMKSAATMLKVT